MSTEENRAEAKRSFVLADHLKRGPFDSTLAFRVVMEAERLRVRALSSVELDSIIDAPGDQGQRLARYNAATWTRQNISLRDCEVWPKMGGRQWAVGKVPQVAERFRRLEPLSSRIWKMEQFASVFRDELPLLVLKAGSQLNIDDGSHRAIAMMLAGVVTASAWVGTPP